MEHLLGASGSKKRRVGEEWEEIEAAAAAAEEEEDRISALPEDLRLRILTQLPLKSAIRTGALSTRWRALWERRWPAPSSLDLHIRPGDDPDELLRSLERRGERRIDRFSLTIHPNKRRPLRDHRVREPQRFLDYAAACGAEDLHIDAAGHIVSMMSTFVFPPGCSHMARLFIRHTGSVWFRIFPCSGAFPAIEVIHLHLVSSVDINKLLWACPRLRILDLRYCDVLGDDGVIDLEVAGVHLRSVTVAECNRITHIDASKASGLRSFCLSSTQLPTYNIPATASLDDLYLSLRGQNCEPIKHWIQALPNLENLSVLTFCSVALRRFHALDRFGSATCLDKLRSLPSLRELQIVMLEMDHTNLAYMYVFLWCCWCPPLERLFVQLPSSRRDMFVDNSLEEAEEDEPDEVLFEVDDPDEELSEDVAPDEEGDEPDEELSDEYEAEEELLLEVLSEEYMLKERLYYEDVYEEDFHEENVPEDEQSEKDVAEDEQSEEDVMEDEQSEEDVPLYGLNNLVSARLMNFKGHYFEIRLVSFLLRRATSLQMLLLVPPPAGVGNYMEAFEEPLDTSRFLETILNFEKASPDAEIILSDSDPAAIQPMHSVVF